jgi:hypothetical protein
MAKFGKTQTALRRVRAAAAFTIVLFTMASMTGGLLLAEQTAAGADQSGGYWLVGSDGGVFTFGGAHFFGSTGSLTLQRPVVGIVPSETNQGYWLVATDGGLFSYGDTSYYGSIPGLGIHPAGSGLPNSLNAPIVGMVRSVDNGGYFMVAADGGVFAFGDAKFAGSCPGIGGCSGTAVAVVPTRNADGGYWVVTSTGNVYGFGVPSDGQPGPQSSPITSATLSYNTSNVGYAGGYYILDANGQVFPYGNADPSWGSVPAGQAGGSNPATAIATHTYLGQSDAGVWVASANGTVFGLGVASLGGMNGTNLNGRIIAMAGF